MILLPVLNTLFAFFIIVTGVMIIPMVDKSGVHPAFVYLYALTVLTSAVYILINGEFFKRMKGGSEK